LEGAGRVRGMGSRRKRKKRKKKRLYIRRRKEKIEDVVKRQDMQVWMRIAKICECGGNDWESHIFQLSPAMNSKRRGG
jgi:hypothetical protein